MFKNLTRETITEILESKDKTLTEDLYNYANEIRRKHVGDTIHLRGIIEFTNFCKNDCTYCGIRRSNKNVQRYRIDPDRIIKTAQNAYNNGYKTVVIQGGEDAYFSEDKICYIVEQIKKTTDLIITLSIGERPFTEYASFKKKGADRFLIKHETSNQDLYHKMHPKMSYNHRIESIKELKRLGFETGSGIMIGLPGQTLESIANDILLFKELEVDMIGMGPYLPHPETPLGLEFKEYPFNIEEITYKAIALTRIVTKTTNLPATTALATVNSESGRINALNRGANVIMLNVTDKEYKENYSIYPEKACLAKQEPLTPEELNNSLQLEKRIVI